MVRATIPDTLASLAVPIDGLKPYGANPRRGNVPLIVDSLTHHGQYRPIVVRAKTFEVLAGNHTLAAARELGWDTIAATFVECSDDEAARIVLMDNRAGDVGSYDDEVLAELLSSLPDTSGTGYDDDDLAVLLALNDPGGSDAGADLGAALDAADESQWPWVKVQLDPDNYSQWQELPGDDDQAKLLGLLHRDVVA